MQRRPEQAREEAATRGAALVDGEDRRQDAPVLRSNTALLDRVPGVWAWTLLCGDFHTIAASIFHIKPQSPPPPPLAPTGGDTRQWFC